MTDAEAFARLRAMPNVEEVVRHFEWRLADLTMLLETSRSAYQALDAHCDNVSARLGQVKAILNSTVS